MFGFPSRLFAALRGATIAQASFQSTRLRPNTLATLML